MMALALMAGALCVACGDENVDPIDDNGNGTGTGDNPQTELTEPVLINENFDAGMPTGWATADADGDGFNWKCSSDLGIAGFGGSGACMMSQSYSNDLQSPLTPDNYLITPEFDINGNYQVSWQACGQDASFAHEYYEVYVVTINGEQFTTEAKIYSGYADEGKDQGTWYACSANIPESFNGKKIAIAFRHCNTTDEFILNIDNIKVSDPTRE